MRSSLPSVLDEVVDRSDLEEIELTVPKKQE